MAQNLPPFRAGAARHRTTSYTQTFTPGIPIQIPLNRQGYLAELQVKFEGTVTVGSAGTVTDPYATVNLFPLIALRSPQGDYLISLSSRSLYNFQHRFKWSTLEALPNGASQIGNVRPGSSTFSPASATAQAVDLSYRIPISMNLGQCFETGLLLAQVANNDFYLQLNCAQASDLVGSGTATISSIVGVFLLNFFDDYDIPNVTRGRDFINSNLAAQLDAVVNIATGTTLNNAQCVSVYRELITLGA
jgi:hypothetical protein